ncbi:MAG: aminotransferase class I/II-fold pyridoxal phosphate-dependent enzyme [Actinomycetes bacterium]
MSDISADSLEQLRLRRSAKWRTFSEDVLPLPVAEMDFPVAAPIKEMLIDMVQRSDMGYGGFIPELGAAFRDYSQTHWNWDVDVDQFRLATDVGVAGVEVLRVITQPGDLVVVNSPVYHNFYGWVREAQCEPVDVPLLNRGNGTWDLDFDGLEQAFAKGAKAYILCNPHNPVGTVFCKEHLEQIAALADQYGVIVISDEIHAPLNYTSTPFVPYLAVNEAARKNGICITSASKSWNLAGLKCAQIVTANDDLKSRLDSLPLAVTWRASLLGAWASLAAYRDGQPWLDSVMKQLHSNRQLVCDLVTEFIPRATYFPPESTYLAWIDLNAYGIEDPALMLIDKARVALNDGKEFGPDGKNFVRLNFATSPEILREAFIRMASVLED